MEELDKTFLVSMANLSTKLAANDETVMAEVSFIKSYPSLTEDTKNQLHDLFTNSIESSTSINRALIERALVELGGIIPDSDYLQEVVKMPRANEITDLNVIKLYLKDLFDRQVVINDKTSEFQFYSKCVYMSIITKDPVVIASAINKIQSL